MPIFLQKHIEPEGVVGVWDIQENENFFLERLELTKLERKSWSAILGKGRRKEWLSSRYLLHLLSERENRGSLWKDEFGKPHLTDSTYQISLSHTHEMSAVMAAPVNVGIDIQFFVPRIDRLAHKYMRKEEMESLEDATFLEHLHVYWCAKEAMYKAYGRKLLDFKQNLIVEPFAYNGAQGEFKGKLIKNDLELKYQLWFERFGDYFMVYGTEI